MFGCKLQGALGALCVADLSVMGERKIGREGERVNVPNKASLET